MYTCTRNIWILDGCVYGYIVHVCTFIYTTDFSEDGGPLRADSSECVSPSGSRGVRDALVIVSFTLSNVVQTLWIVGLSTMRHGLVISTDDGCVDITLVQLHVAVWRWHTIKSTHLPR